MVDLGVTFETFLNLLLFLLLTVANSLWIYRNLKNKYEFSITPFIYINLLLFAGTAMFVWINADESEHLHCAWMISQGLVPFKDFWQHHSPFLWVILAPFFKILKPSASIFNLSRFFSVLIFTIIAFLGWQISRKVWQEKARLSVYLLILSSASVLGRFFILRPDLFMNIFLLLGIYFSLEIPGKSLSPSFFAGASFVLAASFVFKQYLLFLLPVIVIFLENNRLGFRKLLVYFLGCVAGSLPLILYLTKNNILYEFILWVFEFNRQRVIVFADFPIAVGLMGLWGGYLQLIQYRRFRDSKALILLIAFCLSSLSSLSHTTTIPGSYYLGFWFILCAVISSGCNIFEIAEKISPLIKKSVVLGLFFSLLITPNFIHPKTYRNTYFYDNKKTISKLINYCLGDTCVVLAPLHPIFSYDATWLYLIWQYYRFVKYSNVRMDAQSKDMAQVIMKARPAVILYNYQDRFFILDLYQKRLISQDDYSALVSFLKENYILKDIGAEKYYIRNDKL